MEGPVGNNKKGYNMNSTLRKKPTIICMGILNIKGDEIRFLAEEVSKCGADVKIMDISLGGEVQWADIPLSEVLAANSLTTEKVFKSSRSDAIQLVGQAGARKIVDIYNKGEVDGVISWAGSVGTSVATMLMRALPIGFPKIMMCTLAAGDVSEWLGNKDIFIMNPISEKGINRVTRKIVANAAAAIVGMAGVGWSTAEKSRPLAALTAYGTTTPTVMKCEKFMESKGWDTIIIHQVGTGATMEDLIRSGQITAIYDITIGELSNTMFNSIYGISKEWDGNRLTAASDMGIPQIVCPGGLAQCAYGPFESVPQSFLDEYKNGSRVSYRNSKTPYIHNPAVTALTPTLEETKSLALEIITKLNQTKGPTALIIPMRGWSAYDQSVELATVERGWAKENGDGPVWWPDPEMPKWSRRATAMWSVFIEHIDKNNPNLDLIKCDMHILDDNFVDLLNKCMDDMLVGKWNKGMYRAFQGVVG
jgi:uncharacterized protein (UPF0261 family)